MTVTDNISESGCKRKVQSSVKAAQADRQRGESHHVVSTCCPWVKRSDELRAAEGEKNLLQSAAEKPSSDRGERERDNKGMRETGKAQEARSVFFKMACSNTKP